MQKVHKKIAKGLNSQQKARLALSLACQKKADKPKVIDLRGICNFCDFFVILSASSDRRAEAIAENIRSGLEEKGIQVRAKEQDPQAQWILIDLFDVIVHIFSGQAREFYNLEKLWQDAAKISEPSKNVPRKKSRKPAK